MRIKNAIPVGIALMAFSLVMAIVAVTVPMPQVAQYALLIVATIDLAGGSTLLAYGISRAGQG